MRESTDELPKVHSRPARSRRPVTHCLLACVVLILLRINMSALDTVRPPTAATAEPAPPLGEPTLVHKHASASAIRGVPDAAHLHGRLIGLRDDGAPALPLVPYPSARAESKAEKREAHNGTCFNRRRSDSLPLSRPIKDVRSEACKALSYETDTSSAFEASTRSPCSDTSLRPLRLAL